jgi:hypothetical protein
MPGFCTCLCVCVHGPTWAENLVHARALSSHLRLHAHAFLLSALSSLHKLFGNVLCDLRPFCSVSFWPLLLCIISVAAASTFLLVRALIIFVLVYFVLVPAWGFRCVPGIGPIWTQSLFFAETVPADGVGAYVAGTDGRDWGVVVAIEGSCWRLDGGRVVKKSTEGSEWKWALPPAPATTTAATAVEAGTATASA